MTEKLNYASHKQNELILTFWIWIWFNDTFQKEELTHVSSRLLLTFKGENTVK